MAESLEKIISAVVRAQLPDAEIEGIQVERDEDSDGDPILRVKVIVTSDMSALDPGKMAGLIRHLRPRLLEAKESSFPIFRFVSKPENDRLAHEAA